MNHPKIEAVDYGSNDIYIFSLFLLLWVCMYMLLCVIFCIALLSPFVLGFCLSVYLFIFLVYFLVLVITVGFVFWFGCSLLSFFFFFYYFLILLFLIIIFYFNNFILFYFFLSFILFFLPFTLSCVADRVVVLRPGVRPVPLMWDSWVQDICPPENSWVHVISNGKSSPRDLHLNAKTHIHSMTSKLQC